MYYIKRVEDRVRLPPNMFGSKPEEALLRLIRERYERRMFRELGLVLSAEDIQIQDEGAVIPGDGGAYYRVTFDLLCFLPHVNEVYVGEVKEIVDFGAFVSLGPLQGLLHVSQISKAKFFYDKRNKQLGSQAEKRSIKKGDTLLFKVSTVSMKGTSTETKIGLTMRPDGLGKLEWLEGKDKKEDKSKAKKKAPKKKEA
ncbi:MAG TPA: DNA-directed RNA polymerase [Candidatus Bilamarchaeaceae archaeon]|nr:DNA-directed RNA polymerase [Candidatus Bilamarchaeaceae archaeon]